MPYLVIDGHSVLFQWKDMSLLHQRNPAQAREELRRILSHLHDTSDWKITLVFDGRSGPAEKPEPGKIHVIYSSQDQTADSVIERLVQSAPDSSLVTVVTADRQEQLTVESFGATVYHPDWLLDECSRNDSEWKETLESARKRARW
jgi:predicted RNA-binding protein with PIN domain